MNKCISNISGADAYIDDMVIYSDTEEKHLESIRKVFQRLRETRMTVNLDKSDFCFAKVKYLVHVIGQESVRPIEAKTAAISD